MRSIKNDSPSSKHKIDFNPERIIVDSGNTTDEELLLDACPYALLISNITDFRILTLNKAAANIFKKSKKELIGSLIEELLELNAGERRRQVVHRIIDEKKPYLLEDYERGIWWRTFFQPILNKEGIVTKVAVLIHNISKEKTQERQQIEQNEEFWTRLIEYSNNAFFIVDEKGVIRYVSESINSITGFKPKELTGKKIYDCVYEPDKQTTKKFFSAVLSERKTSSISHRSIDKNGIIRYMETTANNLLDNPIVRGIILTTRDVTKTHKAEIQTYEMKQYLENIINSTSELIFSIDKDTKITIWNERASQVTGYISKSIVGSNIFSISLIQDEDAFKSYLVQCYKGTITSQDIKIKTKHGDVRLLRIQGSLIKNEAGDVKGIVFTGKDITSDAQIHGHLITGTSYLLLDETNSKAIELLNGLVLNNYQGLFITRDVTKNIFNDESTVLPITQYSFSEKIKSLSDNDAIVSKPSKLVNIITDFFSKFEQSIALIDRVDYLIALQGFPKVMQTIYSISSIASRHNGILLIRLNPAVISQNELAILREELKKLPEQSVDNITIDKKLFDILQFVEKQNQNRSVVSYKHVSKRFAITKVTTAKRISSLADKELITIKKKGRLKTIFITDKGKRLLQRRKVV